jgi:hypothetical protein
MGWGGSDLYMYEDTDGSIRCSACRFDDPWIVQLNSLTDALMHIARHRDAGHSVPEGLEDAVRAENPWTSPPNKEKK